MKKIIALVLLTTMLLSFAVFVEAAECVEIHVAVNGSDVSGKGTIDKPYATLEGAKNAVQKLRKENISVPVDVIFHEGTYRFSNVVSFKTADSGTKESPVTYRGAEGENVVFKGSVELDLTKIKLVQDMKILERLPLEARGEVGYIDLKEQGIYNVPENYYYSSYDNKKYLTYSSLYLNGREQPVAQWPNGLNVYSSFSRAVARGGSGETGAGATLELKDYRLKRWDTATDAWVNIFGGNDYQMDIIPVKGVNPDEKTMTLAAGSTQGMGSTKSKRFKIWNLIEELDRPGEWYIDRDKLILYYYPEQKLADSIMELTVAETDLINMDATSNITFKDITFSQVKGRAIKLLNRCENVTIDNCTFKDIGETAIWHFTNKRGNLGQGTIQASDFLDDGLMNFVVKNCTFKDIGYNGIFIRPVGSASTLELSGSVIENNYFTNIHKTRGTGMAVNVYGFGAEVRNNLIHNTHDGVYFQGVDIKVHHNEAYNVHKYSSDAGTFYTGRNYIARDNEVYNNFSKDVSNVDPHMNTNYCRFVYIDDAGAGLTVRNNIFIGEAYGGICLNGGQDNHIYDNILIDNDQALLINSWLAGDKARVERETSLANDALKNEHWSKYHDVIKLGISEKYLAQPALNSVYNNIMMNGYADISPEQVENSDVHDNIVVTEDVFVDSENGDYRIKDEELIKKFPNIPSEENFDYNDIGIDVNEFTVNPVEQESFRLLYPKNGAVGLDNKEINFTWQKSTGADGYRFVLATDPELKNRIIDEKVFETVYTTDKIEAGNKSYYWKVYAYNDSLHFADEWESYGVPYNFVTAKTFTYDTTELESMVMSGKARLQSAKECEKVGEYITGYKTKLTEKCELGQKILDRKLSLSDEECDNLVREINDLINNDVYINGGYLNISEMLEDQENWYLSASGGRASFAENGNLVMAKGEKINNFGYEAYKEASRKIVVTFKLKADFDTGSGSNWLAFGMRGKTGQTLYNVGNDQYYILFKEGVYEYQKNSNGTASILASGEDARIKSGEWLDIQFGVIDLNLLGVLTIIKLNGEVLYQAIDTQSNRVNTKGALNFMATGKVSMEIAPGTDSTDDINALIDEYTLLMTEQYCNRVETEVGDKTAIMQVGSKKAYVDEALTDITEPIVNIGGNLFVPVNTANQILKTNAYIAGNDIYVSYEGNNFKFTNGSNNYTFNGEIRTLPFNVENNMIPIKEMASDSSMIYFYYNTGMVLVMKTNVMNYANYDTLLSGASDSLSLYK